MSSYSGERASLGLLLDSAHSWNRTVTFSIDLHPPLPFSVRRPTRLVPLLAIQQPRATLHPGLEGRIHEVGVSEADLVKREVGPEPLLCARRVEVGTRPNGSLQRGLLGIPLLASSIDPAYQVVVFLGMEVCTARLMENQSYPINGVPFLRQPGRVDARVHCRWGSHETIAREWNLGFWRDGDVAGKR